MSSDTSPTMPQPLTLSRVIRQTSSEGSHEPVSTPRAGWAYGALLLAAVFGVFASGGPLQVAQGGMAVVAGVGLLLAAPSVALLRVWWVAAGAVVVLAALAFLPREWGYDPEWRRQVEALGVATGGQITAHPAVSFQHWVRLGVTVAIGMWILGHRLTDRDHARVLLAVAWAAGVYAALSVWLDGRADRWAWDPVETFGLFTNRSHTATLLVIGLLAALTAAIHHIRHRRGGRAALATLPGMACAGALLGYSISRAGLLLLGLGLAACLAGLLRGGWSRRTAIAVTSLVLAVAGLFWLSDAEIKSRLYRPAPGLTAPAGGAGPDAATALQLDLGLKEDGRKWIFLDTFDLIRDAWWTGAGRGMFEHVIPQYRRRSASENRCLHPESDWLLLASEAGVPCALALATLVSLVAVAAGRSAWKRRGWSLRWGGLVAALVVPVHGLFDTPGHLPVLGLLALLLAAAALRPPREVVPPPGPGSRLGLRAAGALTIIAGAWLLWAQWSDRPTPVVAGPRAVIDASLLYYEDQLAQDAAPTASTDPTPSEPDDDLLRDAIALIEEALDQHPLDATLHYQRGMLALHFDELDAVADQAFAVQRLLDPQPPGVALRQAQGWAGIDPDRTAMLWREALRRAGETTRVSSWVDPVKPVPLRILDQARASDPLMRQALELFRADPVRLRDWAALASPALLDQEMPALLDAASPADRPPLLDLWKARGTKGAAEAHEAATANFSTPQIPQTPP